MSQGIMLRRFHGAADFLLESKQYHFFSEEIILTASKIGYFNR